MQGRLSLLLLTMALLLSGLAAADIYTWTDEQGRTHFGDRPVDKEKAEPVQVRINTFESVTYKSLDKTVVQQFSRNHDVVMYATQWCGVCKRARRYFNDNGIAFTEYDIDQDADARKRYDALGASGVPVILVGDRMMNGFSPAGFKKIYQ